MAASGGSITAASGGSVTAASGGSESGSETRTGNTACVAVAAV